MLITSPTVSTLLSTDSTMQTGLPIYVRQAVTTKTRITGLNITRQTRSGILLSKHTTLQTNTMLNGLTLTRNRIRLLLLAINHMKIQARSGMNSRTRGQGRNSSTPYRMNTNTTTTDISRRVSSQRRMRNSSGTGGNVSSTRRLQQRRLKSMLKRCKCLSRCWRSNRICRKIYLCKAATENKTNTSAGVSVYGEYRQGPNPSIASQSGQVAHRAGISVYGV